MSILKHPLFQRAVLGAGLGAVIGSGAGKGVGAQFLKHFLEPLATNTKAIGVIAAYMYEAERNGGGGPPWLELSEAKQEVWRGRAGAAVQAMIRMMSEAVAGPGRSRSAR